MSIKISHVRGARLMMLMQQCWCETEVPHSSNNMQRHQLHQLQATLSEERVFTGVCLKGLREERAQFRADQAEAPAVGEAVVRGLAPQVG